MCNHSIHYFFYQNCEQRETEKRNRETAGRRRSPHETYLQLTLRYIIALNLPQNVVIAVVDTYRSLSVGSQFESNRSLSNVRRSFVPSFLRSFTVNRSFDRWFVRSFVCSFVRSLPTDGSLVWRLESSSRSSVPPFVPVASTHCDGCLIGWLVQGFVRGQS